MTPFDQNADYESQDKEDGMTDLDTEAFFEGLNKDRNNNGDGDDDEKRQDMSLRMAVDLADSWVWRRGFAIFLCSIYMGAFLYKSSK